MAALFIASNEGYKVQFVDGQQKNFIEALGNVTHTLITSRFEAVLRIGICPVLFCGLSLPGSAVRGTVRHGTAGLVHLLKPFGHETLYDRHTKTLERTLAHICHLGAEGLVEPDFTCTTQRFLPRFSKHQNGNENSFVFCCLMSSRFSGSSMFHKLTEVAAKSISYSRDRNRNIGVEQISQAPAVLRQSASHETSGR